MSDKFTTPGSRIVDQLVNKFCSCFPSARKPIESAANAGANVMNRVERAVGEDLDDKVAGKILEVQGQLGAEYRRSKQDNRDTEHFVRTGQGGTKVVGKSRVPRARFTDNPDKPYDKADAKAKKHSYFNPKEETLAANAVDSHLAWRPWKSAV